jgi:RHS repeat-associated protein
MWFNQAGNRWSDPHLLRTFPKVDNLTSVQVIDLLGNGTACIVWSSPLPGDRSQRMRYIDLMGGQKPHLMTRIRNNLGAETRLQYTASTKFYLEDKQKGTPWITRIPFPVHVVERVQTYDHVSRNRFVTRYSYHHGYFDGIEREFRGFGRVEQRDTEEYEVLNQDGTAALSDNIDPAFHVPPVLTKTWFHTGAYIDGQRISRLFEREYYRESDASAGVPGLSDDALKSMLLDDTVLPSGLSAEEEREACRSLKGAILRQEVYGLDKSEAADRPYSVSERNYTIEPVQARGQNRHGVFFTYGRETVDYHYERKLFKVVDGQIVDAQSTDASAQELADPRVTHTINLSVDAYGNILQSVAIVYGRRFEDAFAHVKSPFNDEGKIKQRQTLITFTENRFTHAVEADNAYRTPLPWETRTFEVLKVDHESTKNNLTNLFRFDELKTLVDTPAFANGTWDLPYHDVNHEGATENRPYRRLIEHVRTVYRKNDLSAFLRLEELESLALPGETFKLAFTPGLLNQVFQRPKQGTPDEKENLLPDPVRVLPVDLADRDDRKVADRGGYVSSQTLKDQNLFPADASQPFWTSSDEDGNWWIPSGQIFYSPEYARDAEPFPADELAFAQEHFFLPHRFCDPFDENTVLTYDDYNLLLKESHDPLENQIQAVNDYRVLQPRQITDPNGNRSQVAFDALGMVVATAVMGKAESATAEGDSLEGVEPDLLQSQIDDFYGAADPHSPAIPLLGNATTRIVYDLEAYQNSQKAHPDDPARCLPVYAATIARETHATDPEPAGGLKVQISFSYSDGFGREIQKKIQAERGPLNVDDPNSPVVDPRWVGSGWTIFNNKGKPVRQYEPFFSAHHGFEFAKTVGVSSTLFYDPVERVVATLHPNHTYEKVVFDPWQQTTYDVNDTIGVPANPGDPPFDPKDDPDVGFYFSRVPDDEYLPTWYDLRQAEAVDSHKKKAADKAAVHANTPTVAYFDSLGRTVLTVAHNRSQYRDKPIEEDYYTTLVRFDLEGNQREVVDAKGRIVMRYDYDLLGNRIHQASMEAGQRWMLNDVAGKPIYAWDSRGHQFRTEYDALRRPLAALVQGALATDLTQEICYEKTEYGEGQTDASGLSDRQLNLRTRVFRQYDSAGIVTNLGQNPETGRAEAYDFKGNLLHSSRQFAQEYKTPLDWNQDVPLEPGLAPFTSHTTYDALNRPVTMTAPDQSEIRPTYNEANLLEGITARLQGGSTVTPFVTNIDYNARGQRLQIEYGNGVTTHYTYDSKTFRLINLYTRRGTTFTEDCGGEPPPPRFAAPEKPPANTPCGVQNLRYVYDPVGNITHIQDDAQQTIYFDGQVVRADCDYTYDAIYRLIEATGREHLGQVGNHRDAPIPLSHDDSMRMNRPLPTDGQAMGRYWQWYVYDAVGNFLEMAHRGGQSESLSWTRKYEYGEASLLEGNPQKSNRLSRTVLNPDSDLTHRINEAYSYDEHGNMTTMPHLSEMRWDFKDQLQMSQRQKVNDDDLDGEERKGERTYYVYDAAGQRVRKVTELANGNLKDERIYLGSFEVYRKHSGEHVGLVRESLHIMDDQQRIAMIETRNEVNDGTGKQLVRYEFCNHLGSTSLELDEQGQIASYEEYTPYGSTSYQAVRNQTEIPKRYRYTGKERDEESGFYYHGARYYAPWVTRWITTDPKLLEPPLHASELALYLNNQNPQQEGAISSGSGSTQTNSNSSQEESGHWFNSESKSQRENESTNPPKSAGINGYLFVLCNPLILTDTDGKAPTHIGYVYVIRGTINGENVVYTGSTGRALRKRFSDHKWKTLIQARGTTIEAYKITAELNVSASNRKSSESALNEALRSAEQVVIKRRRSEPGLRELNDLEAAKETNIDTWAERHNVRLGKRFTVKAGVRAGVAGAFAGLQIIDVFLLYRDLKLAQYQMAPYLLEDKNGVYSLVIKDRGIFRSNLYYKKYETGELSGQSFELSKSEFSQLREEAEALWGTTDWKGDWVPGLLMPELPIVDSPPDEVPNYKCVNTGNRGLRCHVL